MDYTIFIGSALNPKEQEVSKTDTVRGLLTDANISFDDGNVQLNGEVLGSEKLNQPLSELNIEDGDYITVTSKQSSGKQ